MYKVRDYYETIFGETVYVADTVQDCYELCNEFAEETDGECNLIIITPDGRKLDTFELMVNCE